MQKPTTESPKTAALTHKQAIFVTEYLIDLNATQAATRAGYSKRSARYAGCKLLTNANIKAAVEQEIEARKQRNIISADEIVRILADLIRSDMADFIQIDEGGAIRAFPLGTLAEGKSKLIKKVREKRVIRTTKGTEDNPDGEQILDSTYEFELHDKIKPIELGMRHLGMLTDKTEIDMKQPIQVTLRQFFKSKPTTEGKT